MYGSCIDPGMGKSAMLSEKAYAALHAAKRSEEEGLSQVILRHVPPPIRTLGDLEKHLENLDGPVIPDLSKLRRIQDGRYKPAKTQKHSGVRHSDPPPVAGIGRIDR